MSLIRINNKTDTMYSLFEKEVQLAVFPDRWGVVSVISGICAISGIASYVELFEFPFKTIDPSLFIILSGLTCLVTWRLHKNGRQGQIQSMEKRTDAIINASKNDIQKLETLFKNNRFRDNENSKEYIDNKEK
jgi:hypothetical protein